MLPRLSNGTPQLTPNPHSQRIQGLQMVTHWAKRRAGSHADRTIYFICEQVYRLSASGFEHVGSEVLTRILGQNDRERFFQRLHSAGKSIPLVIACLRWALMEIVSGNISHSISINIFAGDFMSRGFSDTIMHILREYRPSDTGKIEFELLEYGDPGRLDRVMITERYRQLKDNGLSSVIDDFDLLGKDRENISRILLEILYPLGCRKIKLDWKTTQGLLNGDQALIKALEKLQRNYPGLVIQAEGVRISNNTRPLEQRGINLFQGSSFGDL